MRRDPTYQFEAKIHRQINAFLLAKQKGIEVACQMYKAESSFIRENQYRSFEDVRTQLLQQLERVRA